MFDCEFGRKENWFLERAAADRDHEEQDILTAAFSHDEVTEMIASDQGRSNDRGTWVVGDLRSRLAASRDGPTN